MSLQYYLSAHLDLALILGEKYGAVSFAFVDGEKPLGFVLGE
jgi:hypothetical protein